MSFETIVDDGQHTTDDRHPMITIAHHESMNGSGQLKKACQITKHAKSELTEGNFLLFQECTNCLKNDFNFGELISRGFLLFWRKNDLQSYFHYTLQKISYWYIKVQPSLTATVLRD